MIFNIQKMKSEFSGKEVKGVTNYTKSIHSLKETPKCKVNLKCKASLHQDFL